MPDIKPDETRTVATLARDLYDRIGFRAKAETLENLLGEVQRIERFVQVPREFKQMLAKMAAQHGVRVPPTFAYEVVYKPGASTRADWERLVRRVASIRDLEELLNEIAKRTGLRLQSRTFRELAVDLVALKDAVAIPPDFIEEVNRVVASGKRDVVSAPSPKAAAPAPELVTQPPTPPPAPPKPPMMAVKLFSAPSPQPAMIVSPKDLVPESKLHDALIRLAEDAGLHDIFTGGAARLYARLRKLAGASAYVARKLKFIEQLYEGDIERLPPASIPPSIPPPVAAAAVEKMPNAGESSRTASQAPVLPLFVRQFRVSVFGLDWTDEGASGAIKNSDAEVLMEPFGSVMAGPGRRINLGTWAHAGMATFFLFDPVSEISAAGKFPTVEDRALASRQIAQTKKDMSGGHLSNVAEKNRVLGIIDRLEKGEMTPFEYEFRRIAAEFAKLEIPAERLFAGAVFFAGSPLETSFGPPPAQVLEMLRAMQAAGFHASTLGMLKAPCSACGPIVFHGDGQRILFGGQQCLRLNATEGDLLSELQVLHLGAISSMRDAGFDEQDVRLVERYHLPVAAGRWWQDRTKMKDHLSALIRGAFTCHGDERRDVLFQTYRSWHEELPALKHSEGSGEGTPGAIIPASGDHHGGGTAVMSTALDAFAMRAASLVCTPIHVMP
jgi:hypothetical protein